MHVVEKDLRCHQADLALTVRGERSTQLSEFDSACFQHLWADSRFQFCSKQTNTAKHPEEHRSTVIAVNATLKEQMHQHLRWLSQQCGWWLSYTAGTRCMLCYSVLWVLNAFRHILQASCFLEHTFYSIIHQLQIQIPCIVSLYFIGFLLCWFHFFEFGSVSVSYFIVRNVNIAPGRV